MAYPVTLNGRTYTLADFEGTNYVDGLPDAFEDFVTHAGNTYQTTSTTSIALGTGTKVFTVADSGKPYASGTPLRISNQADATDYIDALVTTYTGTTLTVNAIGYSGTGTIAAWNINIGGGPITVAGTLPINQGGTGATTAAAAATALGLGTGDTPTFAGLNVTGTANFGDVNITNVGDISLDTISSDAGTSVTVNLGSDAGDDFIVGSNYLVVEGDTGKIGVGNAAPATALDVTGSVTADGLTVDTSDQVIINHSGDGGGIRIDSTNNTNTGSLRFGDAADNYIGAVEYNHSTDALSFYVNNATRTTISSAGILTTQCTAGSGNYAFGAYNPTSTSSRAIALFQSNVGGTQANKVVIQCDGAVGIGTSSPSRLLSLNSSNASIDFSDGTWKNEIINSSGQMEFRADHTSAAGTSLISFSVDGSEAGRFDSTGNLLLNTTTTVRSASALGVSIEADGRMFLGRGASSGGFSHLGFVNVNGIVGTIVSAGSSTTYNTSSDYRIKENVTPTWDATTRLKQLNPVRFNFIADPDTTVDGFLAHEVQNIVPEAITGEKDGMRDEEYQVSAATGDIYTPAIDAVLDEDGVEVTPAVAEVIHSTDVERPEELAEGQQWRETTAAVMGTRSVPDYQGIDQSKLTPLLTKALIEAVEKIEQLETRIAALEA